jgi:hypothetical protein
MKFICPNGHRYHIKLGNWNQGQRCGKCNIPSKPETQLLNYIKVAYSYLNIIHQDRTTIKNPNTGKFLEFDIWLPELNKAIEMNGVNVHYGGWAKNNDIIKQKVCEDKNIQLLIITDLEWYTNTDEVKHKLYKFIKD